MPCRHVFGDLEGEAVGRIEPRPLIAHPKAEGLFGARRGPPAEPVRAAEDAQLVEEETASRH